LLSLLVAGEAIDRTRRPRAILPEGDGIATGASILLIPPIMKRKPF